MSSITDFNRLECELIPGSYVNAYVEPKLNPLNLSELIIDSSWGEGKVDLIPVVKKGETTTHLKLSPENTPVYLEHDNEDGEHECIHGDNLAKIIPLMKLKDVDDTVAPVDGDVLIYDVDTGKFKAYQLAGVLGALGDRISQGDAQIAALNASVQNLTNQVNQLVAKLTPPAGAPDKVVFGDINLYSDSTNSNSKAHGFFTHDSSVDVENDERFA